MGREINDLGGNLPQYQEYALRNKVENAAKYLENTFKNPTPGTHKYSSAVIRSNFYKRCLNAQETVKSSEFESRCADNARKIKAFKNFSFAAAQFIAGPNTQENRVKFYDVRREMMGSTTKKRNISQFLFDAKVFNMDAPLNLKNFENMRFTQRTFVSYDSRRVVNETRDAISGKMNELLNSITQTQNVQDQKYYQIQYYRLQQQQFISTGEPENTQLFHESVKKELDILKETDLSSNYTYDYGWRDSWFQTRDDRIKQLEGLLSKQILYHTQELHGSLADSSASYREEAYFPSENDNLKIYLDSFYEKLSSGKELVDIDAKFYTFLKQHKFVDTFLGVYREQSKIEEEKSNAASNFTQEFQRFNDEEAMPLLSIFTALPTDQQALKVMAETCNLALPLEKRVDLEKVGYEPFLNLIKHQLLYDHFIEMNTLESKKPENKLVDPKRKFEEYKEKSIDLYKKLSDKNWKVMTGKEDLIFPPLKETLTLANINYWRKLIDTKSLEYQAAKRANETFLSNFIESYASKVEAAIKRRNHYEDMCKLPVVTKPMKAFGDIENLGALIRNALISIN